MPTSTGAAALAMVRGGARQSGNAEVLIPTHSIRRAQWQHLENIEQGRNALQITTWASSKRARALKMVRRLYKAARGDVMRWCSVDVIVKRPR